MRADHGAHIIRSRTDKAEITMSATVVAVSRSPTHSFSKTSELGILLVAGRGVDGDATRGRR